jgi:N-glycosylase/DNA lyase
MTRRSRHIKELISAYRKIKPDIDRRLSEFRSSTPYSVLRTPYRNPVFEELCFCLFTANANATKCDEALGLLRKDGCHTGGCVRRIRSRIKGYVRFHNKKAEYLVLARKKFPEICEALSGHDIVRVRDWLAENVKGYGYKEASHFLRNIGLGSDIAILDRHILKNLKKYGVISSIPGSVGSRKIYLEIEDKMRRFSKAVRIPMDELDLLFWSLQTGFIFK